MGKVALVAGKLLVLVGVFKCCVDERHRVLYEVLPNRVLVKDLQFHDFDGQLVSGWRIFPWRLNDVPKNGQELLVVEIGPWFPSGFPGVSLLCYTLLRSRGRAGGRARGHAHPHKWYMMVLSLPTTHMWPVFIPGGLTVASGRGMRTVESREFDAQFLQNRRRRWNI